MSRNPQAEIAKYKKTVEDRGYDAFSEQSRDEWTGKHGQLGYGDLKNLADYHTKNFLDSLANPDHPGFEKNRARFKGEFDGSEKAVGEHFKNQVNMENGRPFKGNHGLFRDTSHEARMLATEPITSNAAHGEATLLKDLMQSRWQSQGYTETPGHPDNDSDYVNKFYNEYCIALKPARAALVS